jgi:hypothetical protein
LPKFLKMIWKPIRQTEEVNIGHLIAAAVDELREIFEVKKISGGYVTIIPVNNDAAMMFFPIENLVAENWCIKEYVC